MGLNEDAVDLLEIHDAGLVTDGFDERAQTQVAGAAQETFAGTNDERQRFGGEGVMAEASAVELIQNERLDGFGGQTWQECRVSDPRVDFLVDGQRERLQQGRLADEHQVMRAWEVLAQQAEFAQAVRGHEVGVINDGHEHFAGAMDAEGLLHQQAFAVVVAALEFDLERLAQNAQRVVVSVQGAVERQRFGGEGVLCKFIV